MVNINGTNKKLILNYKPKTSKTTIDICDMDGNILCNSKIENGILTETYLNDLKNGIYEICIIDGDELIKERFEIL